MESAILKINRRIKDLETFDISSVENRYDPRIEALSNELDNLLANIYGAGTVEYERYHWGVTYLDTASMNMAYETPINEVREGLQNGISRAKTNLETIKKGFIEEIEDSGQTLGGKTIKAYDGLTLHPAIERATNSLFHSEHYSNAVEDSVKALNALVKLNSGIEDKEGANLMEYVFSPKNPILKFNDLKDQSDIDEQRGFMMMLSGAVIGFRNPRAHKLIKDDPEKAMEFIAFISLLAKLVDSAKK
ncbi:TIGR02391 family protein [Patescibacteria group bacterium]|nr:TIGR02391 family protein [Patescibacteria group bacterium]